MLIFFRPEESRRNDGYSQGWTPDFKAAGTEPRMAGVNYSRYSDSTVRFSAPEPSAYCRTTVSWDGATRVTHRSCF